MDGLNEVKLIGNVGKDVELRHLENDRKVATIVLATNKTYKKQNGEKESRTEWHNIEFWGDTAQFCGNYVKKGMLLYLCGELRTDSYDKDGVKRYRTKIVGSEIKILANANATNTESSNTASASASTEAARQQSQQYVAEPVSATSDSLVSSTADEDLPF
jgi:single-strand DNA-binding protein